MFGYATDETEECMPLTIVLAHKLNEKMSELRRNGIVPWLRPDSKTQVRSCNMCTFFTYPKHTHHSSLGTFSFKLGYISLENLITCLKLCCHRHHKTANYSFSECTNSC